MDEMKMLKLKLIGLLNFRVIMGIVLLIVACVLAFAYKWGALEWGGAVVAIIGAVWGVSAREKYVAKKAGKLEIE